MKVLVDSEVGFDSSSARRLKEEEKIRAKKSFMRPAVDMRKAVLDCFE